MVAGWWMRRKVGGGDGGDVYTASSRGAWWATLNSVSGFNEMSRWEAGEGFEEGHVAPLVFSGDCPGSCMENRQEREQGAREETRVAGQASGRRACQPAGAHAGSPLPLCYRAIGAALLVSGTHPS